MKTILKLLTVAKLLTAAAAYAQVAPNPIAEGFNAAEMHHIMMAREACAKTARTITGKISEAGIQAHENIVFTGVVEPDADYTALHVDFVNATYHTTPGVGCVGYAVTFTTDGASSIIWNNPTRDCVQGFRFLPRKPCASSGPNPCYCDDPMDILGGFIFSCQTAVIGCPTTQYMRPKAIVDGGLTFDEAPLNWRPGDLLAVPGCVPGEKTQWVRIVPSAAPVIEDVESGAFWTVPNDLPRVMVEVLNPTRVRFTYQRGPSFNPLAFKTEPPIVGNHRQRNGELPFVGHFTGSVKFGSVSEVTAERGHIMAMMAPPSRWDWYEIENCGRTDTRPHTGVRFGPAPDYEVIAGTRDMLGAAHNQKARYAEHFHNRVARIGQPHVRNGGKVHGFLKIGANNHGDLVTFSNMNVGRGHGTGIYTENGIEAGRIENPYVVDVHMPGYVPKNNDDDDRSATGDFGWKGYGIWLHGGGTEVVGGYLYDCEEFVRHYGRPLSEVGTRTFPVANLRDGKFKAGLPVKTKFVDTTAVNVSILETSMVNGRNGIGTQYFTGGDTTTITGVYAEVSDTFLEFHYAKSGSIDGDPSVIVKHCEAYCTIGMDAGANNVTHVDFDGNTLRDYVTGFEYGRSGNAIARSTYVNNVFFPKTPEAVDIRLPPVTQGVFNEDVREVNTRAGGPVRVVGP